MDTLVRVSADLFEVGQIYGYRVERAALERDCDSIRERCCSTRTVVQLRAPCVIYEMHVAGFTKHPSSGVDPAKRGISSEQILQRNRGTFLAKNGKDFSRYLCLIF
jgi:pullulanase/glycogen debranching enzyme